MFKRRFWVASIVLLTIFFINLYGLYEDGFSKKYYFVTETEHLVASFFLAMWLSSFSRSIYFILSGVAIFTVFWESIEYSIALEPTIREVVQNALKSTDTAIETWDTILDIFLNFAGASVFIYYDRKKISQVSSNPKTDS